MSELQQPQVARNMDWLEETSAAYADADPVEVAELLDEARTQFKHGDRVLVTDLALGSSNTNDRGSSYDRQRRRAYLVETYRADQDLVLTATGAVIGSVRHGNHVFDSNPRLLQVPACRCYRCGVLLVDLLGPDGWAASYTVTVDRIVPGCKGGTYRRNNIRPACGPCNSETGGHLGAERKRGRR